MKAHAKFRCVLLTFLAAWCAVFVAMRSANAQPYATPPRYPGPVEVGQGQGYPLPPINQPPARGPQINPNVASAPSGPINSGPSLRNEPVERVLYEPAKVVAEVGDQPIFLGDLLGTVNQILEPFEGQYPESVIEKQRQKLLREMLDVVIDNKLLYLDFLRNMDMTKMPEIEKRVYETFNEKQLPVLVAKYQVNTPAELDVKLRSFGTSIDKMRRAFLEQAMGSNMISQKMNLNPEITHEEMLDYYREHINDFGLPAQARWEHLMARFDRFPTRLEAERAIVDMGNQILLGGASLSAVAKKHSQSPDADRGGFNDWTTKGSLVSEVLDEAIFNLPLNALSTILEDDDGYHIVRVLERRDEGWISFKAPAEVRLEEYTVHDDDGSGKIKIAARLANSSPEDITVEMSAFVINEQKFPIFQKSIKVDVPRQGTTTADFELTDLRLSQPARDVVRVSIEPQMRIKYELRKEKIEGQREEYVAELRRRTPPKIYWDDEQGAE